ncbi:PIN domain-containing protein [Kribbella sp. NPDC058693]|uniref:PIN domain-containing protein n=1 Tax=Kribbella sp. NPDC058693 TaxID=3346602 RepID=UPI00365612C2
MRLNPGVSLVRADEVLRDAETTWGNVLSAQDFFPPYINAIDRTYSVLRQTFAVPDVADGLHSTAYWNLLSMRSANPRGGFIHPDLMESVAHARHGETNALRHEIETQIQALADARAQLDALKALAGRSGLPVVYDTNMLNHWQQPGDIDWKKVLKGQGETVKATRLVVPLRVIDELDGQKYGQGDLARKAAIAIRYLERVLRDSQPGQTVELREGVALEVWTDTDDRGGDADLSILRCAADLDVLHPDTGARVLTNDFGMRLRARQMGLAVVRLPEIYRKPGTAIDDSSGDQE